MLPAIERVWGFLKLYTRNNCGYSLVAIRRLVPEGLASIPVYMARRFYIKSIRYLDIYEAVQCSAPLADLICRVYRSHHRVCDSTIEGAIRKAAKASPEHKDTLLALLGPRESTGTSRTIETSSTTVAAGLGNGGAEGDGGADEEQSAGADMGESHGDDGEWEDAY